jgi:uncharacterized protein YdeI (BOF family)
MTITLEGNGNGIKAFREAAIRVGGTAPIVQVDFARAEFSTVDMKVEAQADPRGKRLVTIRGSSLSNVGRSYEFKDNIGEITERIALEMESSGFKVRDRKRDRAI